MPRYVIFTTTTYDDKGRPDDVFGVFQVPPCFVPNDAFLDRAESLGVHVHLSQGDMDGRDFPAWAKEGGKEMWLQLSAGAAQYN